MPAKSQVPLRKKFFHLLLPSSDSNQQPQHGHHCEYLFAVINLLTNCLFVVGSFCFFEDVPLWVTYLGDWLFIIGSVVTFALALCSLQEAREAAKHEKSDVKKRNEAWENISYCVASFIFLMGCCLYMPEIYKKEVHEIYGHEAGAWCFIFGSLGFVVASHCQTRAMAWEWGKADQEAENSDASEQSPTRKLSSISLHLGLLGSVCFVTGSFLYRPGYVHRFGCGRARDEALLSLGMQTTDSHGNLRHFAKHSLLAPTNLYNSGMDVAMTHPDRNPLCTSAIQNGTWLYVVGSFLFVAQACLSLACTVISHRSSISQ